MYQRTFASLTSILAATLFAMGCRDSLAPEREGPGVPVFSASGTTPTVEGVGAIGDGLAMPLMNRQEFDFDVTGAPGGRFFIHDYSVVRTNGSVGSMTADAAVDPATGISSFAQTSARCVTFGGIGRVDTGDLFAFSAEACDNASPGAGLDSFSISVPEINYSKTGELTDGEITLSGATLGDIHVTAITTGTDLDADGYTVTLDSTTSQPIGTNATAEFNALAEGTYTVALSGVAENCTVSDSNPRTLTVIAGQVTGTTYDVSCTTSTTVVTRITGLGALGDGLALPTMDRLEFDFDVTSALSGRVVATDYSIMRSDGSAGTMTVDPATDPETSITSFTRTSDTCVSFGGVGRLNDGGSLYDFFIDACDNANPGVGADTFSINLPDRPYSNSGTLTEGDIAISTF